VQFSHTSLCGIRYALVYGSDQAWNMAKKKSEDMSEEGEHHGVKKRANLCGARLRALREREALTIAAACEALQTLYGLSLSQSDLADIEAETQPLTDGAMAAFACFYQVSADYLVWGETLPDRTLVREVLQEIIVLADA
jgi:hypothetical protein